MADTVEPTNVHWATAPAGRLTRPISWGAIFAGAVVATVIQIMLGLLGLSIGLATIAPLEEAAPAQGFAIGEYIWWLIAGIIALFIGGWATARLALAPRALNGALHGLVVWGVATLFMGWVLTTTIGSVVGGAFSVFDRALGYAVMQADGAGMLGGNGQQTPAHIRAEARGLAAQASPTEIDQAVNKLFDQDGPTAADKEAVVNVLVQNSDLSEQQARQHVNQWAQTAQTGGFGLPGADSERLGQRTEEVASRAVGWGAATSFWAFFMLLIGAGAAVAGGAVGAPKTRWERERVARGDA